MDQTENKVVDYLISGSKAAHTANMTLEVLPLGVMLVYTWGLAGRPRIESYFVSWDVLHNANVNPIPQAITTLKKKVAGT